MKFFSCHIGELVDTLGICFVGFSVVVLDCLDIFEEDISSELFLSLLRVYLRILLLISLEGVRNRGGGVVKAE